MSQGINQPTTLTNLYFNDANNTDNYTTGGPHIYSYDVETLVPLGIFCLVGILGNVLFCTVVFLDRSLIKQKSNILLILMSVGDVIVLTTSYLNAVYLESPYISQWQWSDRLCYFRYAFPVFAQALCIFSLTACSIERYLGVVKFPMGSSSKMWLFTILSVIIIAVLSIIMAGFSWWWANIYIIEAYQVRVCHIAPMTNNNYRWFLVGRFLVIYFIPLCIVSYCYFSIARRISKSSALVKDDHEFQPGFRNSMGKRKKGILVLFGITLSFALLWLPYHVHQLHKEFNDDIYFSPNFDIMIGFYYYSAVANSVLDPVLIFFLSSEHRKAAYRIIIRKHSCSRSRQQRRLKHNPVSTSKNTILSGSCGKKNTTNVTTNF